MFFFLLVSLSGVRDRKYFMIQPQKYFTEYDLKIFLHISRKNISLPVYRGALQPHICPDWHTVSRGCEGFLIWLGFHIQHLPAGRIETGLVELGFLLLPHLLLILLHPKSMCQKIIPKFKFFFGSTIKS